jgi:hypothetical protein
MYGMPHGLLRIAVPIQMWSARRTLEIAGPPQFTLHRKDHDDPSILRCRCLLSPSPALHPTPPRRIPPPNRQTWKVSWQGYDGEWLHATYQLVALAEATPADKFAWRPASGVRSTSEVYMHMVG